MMFINDIKMFSFYNIVGLKFYIYKTLRLFLTKVNSLRFHIYSSKH